MALFSKAVPVTIDGIVADIQQKVDQLHAISRDKASEEEEITEAIEVLVDKRTEATLEGNRADVLANNFAKLLEV